MGAAPIRMAKGPIWKGTLRFGWERPPSRWGRPLPDREVPHSDDGDPFRERGEPHLEGWPGAGSGAAGAPTFALFAPSRWSGAGVLASR